VGRAVLIKADGYIGEACLVFMNNRYVKRCCSALGQLYCMCGSLCRHNARLKSGGTGLTQLHMHLHSAVQKFYDRFI